MHKLFPLTKTFKSGNEIIIYLSCQNPLKIKLSNKAYQK